MKLGLAIVIALAALLPGAASALTVVPDCADWYMHKTDTGLEFKCYSRPATESWLTMAGCLEPSARRDKTTLRVTVTCGAGPCAEAKLTILPKPI